MNLSFNRKADPENMHADIVSWPDQLRVGWQQGRDAAKDHKDAPVPKKVLWAGMGGSAIGGDFLATLLADRAPFPLIVHRGGPLPQWVDEKTLVVLASYSGNTAETLAASREAISRNSALAALTTGGRLGQFADQDRIERWPVQPGRMPRAALAEMLGAAMGAFHEHGWLSIDPVAFEECLRNIEE